MPTITFDKLPNANIGSVRQSFLDEASFQAVNGIGWVLCDGRNVSGSKYETVTGSPTIPDARGRYLRGKDHGAGHNPDGDLDLGEYQADEFKSHDHDGGRFVAASVYGTGTNGPAWSPPGTPTGSRGGDETRPKSITCNIFIKIN